MNLAIPAAPPGPRAPQGGSDGTHSRGKSIAQDFAAALSETAVEQGEDGGNDGAVAKAVKIALGSTKLLHRVEAKQEGAADGKGAPASDGVAVGESPAEPAANPSIHTLPQSGESQAAATTDMFAGTPAVAATASPPPAAMRDVLANLAIDAPQRTENAAALGDLVDRMSRHLPAATRAPTPTSHPIATPAPAATSPTFAAMGVPPSALVDPEAAAAATSDELMVSAKVVRQETHFQPVGQEARRALAARPVGHDDRLLQASLAAATKTTRQDGGDRDRQDAPTLAPTPAARPADAPAPTDAVAFTADEVAPGSVGRQIADGVQRTLAASSPSESAAARPAPATAAAAASTTFAPAVRTIKLQLNPLSLGTVTIVLTGRDSELSIKLEAELAETVGKVEQDRSALTSRLAGAGYAISELTVGRMSGAGTTGAEGDQRESGARAGGNQGGDGSDGRAAQESAAQFGGERGGRHAETRAPAPEGGSSTGPKGGAREHVVAGISYAGRFRTV